MKIDIHSHYYPQDYLKDLQKSGLADADSVSGAPIIGWEGAEGRLENMKIAQVDVEVLSISTPNVFFEDKELSHSLAQMCNDSMSDVCAKHSDHFKGLISVPLPDVDAAIEELHRARRKPGMVGVTLGTNIAGKPLDSPEFFAFYEELDKLRMPVFIHPMLPVDMPHVMAYQMVTNIGFLFETCMASTRLVLSGALEKYPNFPVILCHLGGAIPFISNRIDHAARRYEQTRKNISRPPSDYYRRMFFDTAMAYGEIPLNTAYQFLGDDQIVLGTDFPFTRAEHMRTVPAIESSPFLSDEVREKIYWKNISRIIGVSGAQG